MKEYWTIKRSEQAGYPWLDGSGMAYTGNKSDRWRGTRAEALRKLAEVIEDAHNGDPHLVHVTLKPKRSEREKIVAYLERQGYLGLSRNIQAGEHLR